MFNRGKIKSMIAAMAAMSRSLTSLVSCKNANDDNILFLLGAAALSGDGDNTTTNGDNSVSGLEYGNLVLQMNGGNDLTVSKDGNYTFENNVSGDYSVTVKSLCGAL